MCKIFVVKRSFYLVPYLLVALLSLTFAYGCNRERYNSVDGVVWNTTYHIVYEGVPELKDSVLHVLDSVGASLNFFSRSSALSKINAASDSTPVDIHFRRVYAMSQKINRASDGMFDPTLTPLINAWGFGKGHTPTADTLRIDSLLLATGLNRTSLHGNVLVKQHPDITFNFSAVAKGYGCDCVAAMLRRNGVKNFLVEIGGEIVTAGVNPELSLWNISIDSPLMDSVNAIHDSHAIISITNKGMATSGNYRNFHSSKNKGAYFGHTISPRTGRPVKTDILSATIVAPNAMEADAVATACMAIGSVEAMEMCRNLGVDAYLILSDTVVMTPGFQQLFQ